MNFIQEQLNSILLIGERFLGHIGRPFLSKTLAFGFQPFPEASFETTPYFMRINLTAFLEIVLQHQKML